MARSPRINKESRHRLVRSAFRLSADNLGQKVISGASLTFLGIALRTLITLGSTAILARLLTPADFGHVAMATVVTEFAALIGGFGLTNLLIQRPVITRLHMDTVFWASVGVGSILSLVVFGVAPIAEWFFADKTIGNLLQLLCFNFFLSSLTVVHEATLLRLMRFRTEFWIQIVALGIRSLSAIVLAFMGLGVWSLVISPLIGSTASIVLYYFAVPYLPRFRFDFTFIKSTWKSSSSYFGNNVLYYLNMNADLALIGRSLGVVPLAYYQNARSLTDEIRGRIAVPLQRVLFPAFSALQNNQQRLQTTVMRAGSILAAIIIPIGVGLSAIAEDLVPILYGAQWLAMIPLLSIFGISGAIRGTTAISTSIFYAMNKVPISLRYNFIGTLITICAIIVALPFGIETVTLSVLLSNCYTILTLRAALHLAGLNTNHLLNIISPPTIAATGMWLAIYGARYWSSGITYPFLTLLAHITLGTTTYLLLLYVVSPKILTEAYELAKNARQSINTN